MFLSFYFVTSSDGDCEQKQLVTLFVVGLCIGQTKQIITEFSLS